MTTRRGTSNRNVRGSAEGRRARKLWLLIEFGDGITAPCAFCQVAVDFDTITVDRYPVPGCKGGRYVRGNIRPACGPCNSRHGATQRSTRYAWRYLYRGRVLHALNHALDREAVCGARHTLTGDWYGTGSQREYERAASLAPCKRCIKITEGEL